MASVYRTRQCSPRRRNECASHYTCMNAYLPMDARACACASLPGATPSLRAVAVAVPVPRGAGAVCVQCRRGRGQRGHCATFLAQALLSADITAALNKAALPGSPDPPAPSWRHRAPHPGPSSALRDSPSLLCEQMGHVPGDDFSVGCRWEILGRKKTLFGFFFFFFSALAEPWVTFVR